MSKLRTQRLESPFCAIAFLCLAMSQGALEAVDLEAVQERFENASIRMDRRTETPTAITGIKYRPERLADLTTPLGEEAIDPFFRAFLEENRDVLGVEPAALQMVTKVLRRGTWYVKYQQLHRGVPIVDATVGMVGSEEGEILSYRASYRPDLEIEVKEKVSPDEAIAIVKESYGKDVQERLQVAKTEKVIVAVGEDDDAGYRLVWRISVTAPVDRVENDQVFIVDAQTGEIIDQYPSRFYGERAFGPVTGEIYPENPTDPVVDAPLPHESVDLEGFFWSATTVTDDSGEWSVAAPWWTWLFRGYDASYELIGPYAQVRDFDDSAFAGDIGCRVGIACDFNWTSPDLDHINVFSHINALHDWYLGRLSYPWENPWAGSPRFNAEVNHPFANAYAGDPMAFGTDDFARSSDVVYHECTHNVLYALFGGWIGFPAFFEESYAFDEGFGDYFASAITEDPLHGEGYGGTRTLDNDMQYPSKATYNLEGHSGGPIIAGAAWDLRLALQARLGDASGGELADNLVFDALIVMATMPRDYFFSDPRESNFLSALYLADDDNHDLLDGVPHFWEIQHTFSNHNLLQAQLEEGDSYDVSTNALGSVTGGDFYFHDGAFWSNNFGQRGVQDLGDIGAVALADVAIPGAGYTRQRVNAELGHTYVALAQAGEEGNHIVFRVTELNAARSEGCIEYLYRGPAGIRRPDLRVTSIQYQPRNPERGELVQFSFDVRNQDTGRAAQSRLSIEIDGDKQTELVVPELEPGDTHTATWQRRFLRVGRHELTATADVGNDVPESDENNNALSITFSISESSTVVCFTNDDCPGGTCCEPGTPESYCVQPPRVCK